MFKFRALFPDVAAKETRLLTVSIAGPIPPDRYVFDEYYCVEAKCDCRRTVLKVLAIGKGECVATINHAFEPPSKSWDTDDGQTYLDPLHKQAPFAFALKELFLERVLD